MAKTIEFDYDGVHYTLEFTRATIKAMERNGFSPQIIDEKPMTALPQLFAGAFLEHHRVTGQKKIDEIFSKMPNKEKVFEALGEMYNQPFEELLSEPEDGEKNIEWSTTG